MLYLVLKYLHVLGAIVLLGTGAGIAFFMLMAHRSADAGHIFRTARTVVLADFLFTATAVVTQPVTGVLLARRVWATAERVVATCLDRSLHCGGCILAAGSVDANTHAQSRWRGLCGRRTSRCRLSSAVSTLVLVRLSRIQRGAGDHLADDRQTDPLRGHPMTVLILGASGLIGNSIAIDLIRRGLPVIAVARRFYRSQRVQFATAAREIPIAELDNSALTRLVVESAADVVINCLGLLQDAPGERASDIHEHFIKRLLAALRDVGRPVLLVHLSIPGVAIDDRTTFASSKRDAERAIAEAGMPYAILRPGFVFAPAAYGGSAMMRALATFPFALPVRLATRPFAVVAAFAEEFKADNGS